MRTAVDLAIDALSKLTEADWQAPAGTLTWTCWETVEHIADDLFAYAAQMSLADPPQTTYVPIGWKSRPGGPGLTVYAEPEHGAAGLLQVLDSCAGLLTAVVAAAPADRRAFHPYGVSDAAGFAAMGVVETLVHTADLAAGLGFDWDPPAELCDRVLHRLFPAAPTDTERWPTLLWATGRGELPGRPALTGWTWDGTPR